MNPLLVEAIRSDCRVSSDGFQANLASLRNQAILVTGGTGFMGTWIAEMIAFLNEEHGFNTTLFLLSRDSKEFETKAPHLAKQGFINLIEEDIRNVAILPEQIGWIIHAAGTPDNREHASQPLKTIDVAYKGTTALLEASLRLPALKKVVCVSSNYIYGQLNANVAIEEHQPGSLNCNSVGAAYAEAKRITETVCAVYRNQQQLPIDIVRPFAFMGPYQGLEKPWALNNFIRDSILGGAIRILGNRNTTRSYLYGSDMAYWILSVLASPHSGKVYNIGSPYGISLYELAQKIKTSFHRNIDIVEKASSGKSSAIQSSVPSTKAIENDLNVAQRIDINSSLIKTIEWYESILHDETYK
ncbi:NAD-dependent epimerase/dehydratase family protein [Spirosoma aerolatum]|uniref:NAD-dependent epimerase/dehydratase family protein n=1 Tax=Spirosoma aerolatum TaxID=1211326 RepID=UPI0009AE03DB|nr:NAD-dependent epimerase/dehydratase family protein [Spirosoma aerolatum]